MVHLFYLGIRRKFSLIVDYKRNTNADDLDAIKLMCQQPLASGCDEEFIIIMSESCPSKCQDHDNITKRSNGTVWVAAFAHCLDRTLPYWSVL